MVFQYQDLQSTIQTSQKHYAESKKFLESFIHELNIAYGGAHSWRSLTLAKACKLIRKNLHTLQLSPDTKDQLSMALEFFDPEANSTSYANHIASDLSGNLAQHIHFYWPWEWNYFGLNRKTHSHHHASSSYGKLSQSIELELPAHMATGFALSLAGALICLIPIPGVQVIGAEMIFAGGVFFLEGLSNGEKPYYVDSQTG